MNERQATELKSRQATAVKRWVAATAEGREREAKEAAAEALVATYRLKNKRPR
jgi:hypothetical protein